MTKCVKKFVLISASVYSFLYSALIIGYLVHQRDQLLLIAIMNFPSSLLLFLFVDAESTAFTQAFLLGVLGLIQYSLIGFYIGKFYCEKT
jgi:hypothetical protein